VVTLSSNGQKHAKNTYTKLQRKPADPGSPLGTAVIGKSCGIQYSIEQFG